MELWSFWVYTKHYTLEDERLEPTNQPWKERKMIWTKPPWLCSMLVFRGVAVSSGQSFVAFWFSDCISKAFQFTQGTPTLFVKKNAESTPTKSKSSRKTIVQPETKQHSLDSRKSFQINPQDPCILPTFALQLMVNVGKYTIYMNSMGNWQIRDLSTETSRRWHYNGISVMVIPAFDRESFVMGTRFKTNLPLDPHPPKPMKNSRGLQP